MVKKKKEVPILDAMTGTEVTPKKKRKAVHHQEEEHPIYGIMDEEHVMPKQKIKKPKLPREAANLPIENVVNISEEALQHILDRTDKATRCIAADLLENEIPMLLSYDNATAYAEAVLRDGLEIDVSIDDDVTKILGYLNKLSITFLYCKMVKLPTSIRKRFIEKLTDAFVVEAVADMKKLTSSRKYNQQLRELTTHVNSKIDAAKTVPTSKTKPKSKEGDLTTGIGIKRSRVK